MDFFKKILGDEKGYVPILKLDSEGKLTNTKWFEWPKQQFHIARYIEQNAGEDLYFSPMLYTEPEDKNDARHTAKRNVISCRTVWADADTAAPEVFRLKPTISVETSPDRWHTYWILEDPVDPKTCEELSHSISNEHKEDGVDRGWGLSKRLRVPGSINTKYAKPFIVKADTSGPTYTVGEFAAEYPPVESIEVTDKGMPTGLPDPDTLFAQVPFNGYLHKLYSEKPEKDYSTALHTLEMLLFEQGLDAATVFGICRGAACNKFNRAGRTEAELWHDVLKAEAKHAKNQAEKAKETGPEEPDEPNFKYVVADWSDLDLLTEEERKNLPVTFIDEYADWGKAQSARSARQYHESSAWALLSLIFSEFGHVVPSFGNVPLNLYFLILGETTSSRKSTSKNMMMRFVDALSDPDLGYDYDLGSDATHEALTEALSQRPGRSSLFWRDEVQALFKHASGGGYTAGLLPMLTDAYDGAVNGVLRKTGTKRTKKTKTFLIFYGMGIVTQVADSLTDDDFYSGFLPRVLWTVETDPKKQYGSTDVGQRVDDKAKHVDTAYEGMLRRLVEARAYWQQWKNRHGDQNPTYPMKATEEAWARWQQVTVDLERAADQHPNRADVLSPGAQRLGVSALKCAALLAMLDKETKIELHHMLSAIKYVTEWAKYMEYMARQVSKSKLLKDAETLLEMVSSATKPVPYGKALAHFKGEKNVREFNELLEYAETVGMVFVDTTGSRKTILPR